MKIVLDPQDMRSFAAALRAASAEIDACGARLRLREPPPHAGVLPVRQLRVAHQLSGPRASTAADAGAWLILHAELAEIDWTMPGAGLAAAKAFMRFRKACSNDYKGANPPPPTTPVHRDLDTTRTRERDWVPGSGTNPGSLKKVPAYSPPEKWVKHVNKPGLAYPGRDTNCLDCARAVESTWRGQPAASAAEVDGDGAQQQLVTNWSGGAYTPVAGFAGIEETLLDLGPGSSVIIGVRWNNHGRDGGGHAFNAVNDGGVIKFIDAQDGTVMSWPPSDPPARFDEQDVLSTSGCFFDASGHPAVPTASR